MAIFRSYFDIGGEQSSDSQSALLSPKKLRGDPRDTDVSLCVG